jgi:hypothetical protein
MSDITHNKWILYLLLQGLLCYFRGHVTLSYIFKVRVVASLLGWEEAMGVL